MKVGVLGGGQLGRMLALDGYPLGLTFRFLEPKEDPSVARLGEVVAGEYDDPDAVRRLARGMDVVTYEFENVPVSSARLLLEEGTEVHPAPAALEMAQDRLREKEGFGALDIPTADFRAVETEEGLEAAVEELGAPVVAKVRHGGYDGKGQTVVEEPGEVGRAWEELGGRPLIVEELVNFARELSVLGVRGRDGETAFYPLAENRHVDGILRESVAPAPELTAELQAAAESYAHRLLEELGYVGVLALELFQVDGRLLANEVAPRVHNSGHWTLDGAAHSQFENHVRAVCGLPLGGTHARGPTAMYNLLGRIPDPAPLLEIPGVHLHVYDKSPRAMRKLGHVNVTGDHPEMVRARLEAVREVVEGAES